MTAATDESAVVKIFRWFLILEAVGLIAIVLHLAAQDFMVAKSLARIALVALLPGSLVGGPVVEWFLWPSSTSRETIQLVATAAPLGTNVIVCTLVVLGLRARARHRAS